MDDSMGERRACVVVVTGGVVQGIYADDVDAFLVDFDNIEAGDKAGQYRTDPLAQMDESVLAELQRAGIRVHVTLRAQ